MFGKGCTRGFWMPVKPYFLTRNLWLTRICLIIIMFYALSFNYLIFHTQKCVKKIEKKEKNFEKLVDHS